MPKFSGSDRPVRQDNYLSRKSLFDFSKENILQKGDVSTLRQVYACQQSIIFPDDCWKADLSEEQRKLKKLCLDLLATFGDIICVMYSPVSERSAGVTLLLYVLFYVLFKQMTELGVAYSLPSHQGVHHLPAQSRLFSMADLSTEDFEALWKELRRLEITLQHLVIGIRTVLIASVLPTDFCWDPSKDEDAAFPTSTQEKQTEDTTSRTSSTKKQTGQATPQEEQQGQKTHAYRDRVRLDSGAATRGLQRVWCCIV